MKGNQIPLTRHDLGAHRPRAKLITFLPLLLPWVFHPFRGTPITGLKVCACVVGCDNCVNPEAEGHTGLAEQTGSREEQDSVANAASGEVQRCFVM